MNLSKWHTLATAVVVIMVGCSAATGAAPGVGGPAATQENIQKER